MSKCFIFAAQFSRCKYATRSELAIRTAIFVLMTGILSACGGGNTAPNTSSGTPPADTTSLSGTIAVAAYAGVDKDIETTCGVFSVENNAIDDPQYITNPVTLGGYISGNQGSYSNRVDNPTVFCPQPGYVADMFDFFQVVLVENQELALSVFYADSDDAYYSNPLNVKLRLLDPLNSNAEVASIDITTEGTNTLTIPASQDFIIEVSATADSSAPALYTLSLSQSASAGLSSKLVSQLNSEFVPGEVVVKYREPETAPLAKGPQKSVSRSAAHSSNALSNTLARFTNLAKVGDVGREAKLLRMDANALASTMSFDVSNVMSAAMKDKWRTLKMIEELNEQPEVLYAEPNYLMRVTGTINSPSDIQDANYPQQFNIPMLALPAAWQVSSGEGVTVAVIDTGIYSNHSDLNDNISAGGYDFVLSTQTEGDGTGGRDNNPEEEGGTIHGTHVAGIVAAEGNSIGIRGVAYDAGIIPLRALGSDGVGTSADIAEAILYAAGLVSAGGQRLAEPADVINLSLGSTDASSVMEEAIEQAVAAGSIVVAAAGNDGNSQEFYPAAFEGVIGVSSVDERKSRSSFSNFGSYVDVAAPGGTGSDKSYFDGFQDGILSTVYASEYAALRGTSMAAPHVSGVIALMKAVNPALTPAAFSILLNNNENPITDNIDMPGFSAADNARFFGQGLINASKAVAVAAEADIPDTLIVSPAQLGFVGGNSEAVLRLSNPGTVGDLQVESVTASNVALVTVAPAGVLVDGLGDYNVAIDMQQVAGNTASASISVSYRLSGVLQAPVTVPLFISRSAVASATVGNLNVYLVRWEDLEQAQNNGDDLVDIYDNVGGQLNDGAYTFTFNDVPPGLYLLEASTDNDGDRIWFDRGEAVGGYPLLSESRLIEVSEEDLADLDFEVGYPAFFSDSSQDLSASRRHIGRKAKDSSENSFQ